MRNSEQLPLVFLGVGFSLISAGGKLPCGIVRKSGADQVQVNKPFTSVELVHHIFPPWVSHPDRCLIVSILYVRPSFMPSPKAR